MGQPSNPENFPDCTRCGHSFEAHVRPEGKGPNGEGLPWPCRECDCPGFVVARDLQEDVKHMAGLRLENAIAELFPDHMTESEIFARIVMLVRGIKDDLELPDEQIPDR